jgi:hypothetical protein
MTRKELIYDIKRLLTKSGVTDDSRLADKHIGFLIDQRRAREIRETFKRNPVIEPIWLQDMGVTDLTPVNRSEDTAVSGCDCSFSKAVIPPVVSITDNLGNASDLGVHSIRSICGKYEYHYLTIHKIQLLHPDNIMSHLKFYTKVGNAIYLPLSVKKFRPILILDSPLDGYVNDNTYKLSGELIVGTSYTVDSGSITHNSVKYSAGDSFSAVSATFTGSGKVVLTSKKRQMTDRDEYPMSHTMGEVIKMKILTQDFGVEQQSLADDKNDSTDPAREQRQ